MSIIVVETTTEINASPDVVWKIVAEEFDTVSKWATAVRKSYENPDATRVAQNVPSGRVCETYSFGNVVEKVTNVDEKERELTWQMSPQRSPSFVTDMQDIWTIKDLGDNKTKLTSKVSANLTGIMGFLMKPLLKMNLSKAENTTFEDLRVLLETGKVSKSKQKRELLES